MLSFIPFRLQWCCFPYLWSLIVLLVVALVQCDPHLIVEKGIDAPTNYIGCNHEFTIFYRIDNIGEE